MQPYFYPYLGYFHLIASVDLFLVFDCVQFPRRGRVHRAPLPGENSWLTLPLARQPRDTLISGLRFADGKHGAWIDRLDGLPWMRSAPGLRTALASTRTGGVVDYLEMHLRIACDALGIRTEIRRSSTYRMGPELHAQDRVVALAKATGATGYVNLPGGRALYDRESFRAAGLGLSFVPDYSGPVQSMVHAIATQPHSVLREELAALSPPTG